jgi:hypothetical protein
MGVDGDYPAWICRDCGILHGKRPNAKQVSCYHKGKCGICSKETSVTEPRDFGHLKQDWFINEKQTEG